MKYVSSILAYSLYRIDKNVKRKVQSAKPKLKTKNEERGFDQRNNFNFQLSEYLQFIIITV